MARTSLLPTSIGALALALAFGAAAAPRGALHVPSPDWRREIVYFVLTDRFANGDRTNDDQGAGEFDPRRADRFHGGDLRGLKQRLGYIQGLGATAVWITPPVRNQWLITPDSHAGYHGYWAQHFAQVDPHLGTWADVRALSRALHGRGMHLVQDIVVNHTGDYFRYEAPPTAADPAHGWRSNTGSRPTTAPTQWPFSRNDPRRARDRRLGAYHWTPDIADYGDRRQVETFQMSGLDDLATDHPRVRRTLRASHGAWIRRGGVDAMRVDTAFYVPPSFFADFLDARDRRAPGLREVARRTGRRDFLVFGEGFGIDARGEVAQTRRIEGYVRAPGRGGMDGMLNFPLYGALGEVVARGAPTAVLAERIEAMVREHRRLHWMPSFVDNHDVDRWRAGADTASLDVALAAIFTLPGIPVVYYGTEQDFTASRASMVDAEGRDHFDTGAPRYRLLTALAKLRRGERALTHGTPTLLRADAAGAGALVWRMTHGARHALVALNTARHPVLVDAVATGLAAGTALRGAFATGAAPHAAVASTAVGEGGHVDLVLPPQSATVWTATGRTVAPVATPRATSPITLDAPPPEVATATWTARGRAAPGQAVALVVDGDLARATPTRADAEGRFAVDLALDAFTDAQTPHRLVAVDAAVLDDVRRCATASAAASTPWPVGACRVGRPLGGDVRNAPIPGASAAHRGAPSSPLAAAAAGATMPAMGSPSAAHTLRVTLPWARVADVADPAGDDHGLDGATTYPTDATFRRGQMDLRRVAVDAAGGALALTVELGELSRVWSPANGFDHVALSIFLERRGAPGGSTAMPGQHGALPDGLRWHRRLRVHGWSNALFASDGAGDGSVDAAAEGRPVTPGATLAVDAAAKTLRLTLPASALGTDRDPAGDGWRIWVTTWDYDAGWRPLAQDAGPYTMGRRTPTPDLDAVPRVMDASAVIEVPAR